MSIGYGFPSPTSYGGYGVPPSTSYGGYDSMPQGGYGGPVIGVRHDWGGSYDPRVSQDYYQQNAVNTAYSGYRPADTLMGASQLAAPLAVTAAAYSLGMAKVMRSKGRMAGNLASRALYGSMGLNAAGNGFSRSTRGGLRASEMAFKNLWGRGSAAIRGAEFVPAGMDAATIGAEGSLGVGAATTVAGLASEWLAGPAEIGLAAAKGLNEGVFKPYAYDRAIANQAATQFSGVPMYGSGMGSVNTATGLGSRAAASYGNNMQKYGMSNFFYSQKNVGHLAGLVQQSGLLSDQNTLQGLEKATKGALKSIRQILQVASVSGSEATKMLSSYKLGGFGVDQGAKAIEKLSKYSAASGLSIGQLFSESFSSGSLQGSQLGILPSAAGQYGARVTSKFESLYHNRSLSNALYGVLGGPTGAEQLAISGSSNYAESPIGQMSMYNSYMGGLGNAKGSLPQMAANFGASFSGNPVGNAGLMDLNQPLMKAAMLKRHSQVLNQGVALVKSLMPFENTKHGANAGAVFGVLTSVEGQSHEEARREIYEQLAKQKAGTNAVEAGAAEQQQYRKMQSRLSQSGKTWDGIPRAIMEPFYAAGTVTSEASRGASSLWGGALHAFHKFVTNTKYGAGASAISKGVEELKGASLFHNAAALLKEKNGMVVERVTAHAGLYYHEEAAAASKINAGLNSSSSSMRDAVEGAMQEARAGKYPAAIRTLGYAGISVNETQLKSLHSHGLLAAPKKVHVLVQDKGMGKASALKLLGKHSDYQRALQAYGENPTTATKRAWEQAKKRVTGSTGGEKTISVSGTEANKMAFVGWSVGEHLTAGSFKNMQKFSGWAGKVGSKTGINSLEAGVEDVAQYGSYYGASKGEIAKAKSLEQALKTKGSPTDLAAARTFLNQFSSQSGVKDRMRGVKSYNDVGKDAVKAIKDKINGKGVENGIPGLKANVVNLTAATVNIHRGSGGGGGAAAGVKSQTVGQDLSGAVSAGWNWLGG